MHELSDNFEEKAQSKNINTEIGKSEGKGENKRSKMGCIPSHEKIYAESLRESTTWIERYSETPLPHL